MILQPPRPMFTMSREEIKTAATKVAEELRKVSAANTAETLGIGGGSRQRGLPEDLRKRFVDVRAALFQRGVFDPLLVRFDTATVPQASTLAIADALAAAAQSI
jgi:hypothetical protein